MPGSVLPGCGEELKLRPFSIPSRCPLQMTGVKETNRPCCSPRVFSRELTQAHSPHWHGTELTFLPSGYHLVTERWCAGGRHSSGCDAEILTLHFSVVGQAACCQERWLLPSMHRSPPTPLRWLTEFWLDRYENNFKKITPLCIPNPELLALFCLTGNDKETTTPQWPRPEAHISYPDGETLSDGGAGGAMRSSSRWSDLRSTCLHIPQSLGLASAESVWWPGSPCRAQCCRRGEWAAERFQAHP